MPSKQVRASMLGDRGHLRVMRLLPFPAAADKVIDSGEGSRPMVLVALLAIRARAL